MKKIRAKIRSVLHPRRKRVAETAQEPSDEPGIGAILPPELFPTVLKWASLNDDRAETFERIRNETRGKKNVDRRHIWREFDKAGPAYTLRSCSLVCLYWANRCREYMFTGATFYVWSLEKAELFRKYSVDGCRNLVPICTLIKTIEVAVVCERSRRSYLDLIYLPQTRGKLEVVTITGPLPAGVPQLRHDTPHWSVTNLGTPPPTATAYGRVLINTLNFPSFSHLVKYFKYFNTAEKYYLTDLTWDGKTPNSFAQFFKPAIRRRQSIEVHASRCTDDLIICLQVVTMYPDFPLRLIASQDYAFAMNLMNIVGDYYRKAPRPEQEDKAIKYLIRGSLSTVDNEYHSFVLEVFQPPPNHVAVSMQFFSEVKSSPTSSIESGRTPPIRTRIVCLNILIRPPTGLQAADSPQLSIVDLELFAKSIQRHPSSCTIILRLGTYVLFKECITRFPTLLKPLGAKTFILVFFRRVEDRVPGLDGDAGVKKWIEVDRSCMPTGRQWSKSEDILDEALGR
ncbi:hypothetical protein BC629DRAFT_1594256 [Irpex lacteus]|nr:hypothetical protein BC629DRAFT_1594256 [Irpex lacteus]